MKVVLEAQIDGIASKVDGTVTIKISSQELDNMKVSKKSINKY